MGVSGCYLKGYLWRRNLRPRVLANWDGGIIDNYLQLSPDIVLQMHQVQGRLKLEKERKIREDYSKCIGCQTAG